MTRRTFALLLEELPPQPDEPPPEIRLRVALKLLLRRARLRCVRVEETTTERPAEPCKESTGAR